MNRTSNIRRLSAKDTAGRFVTFGVQSCMSRFAIAHAMARWPKLMSMAVSLALFGAAWTPLSACECGPTPPVCQAYWQSPVVFLGTVMDKVLLQDGQVGWAPSKARMRVDRAYKGVTETELTLYDDGMCDGPSLQVGEQYLMYTHRDPDGGIPSRGCTRSAHVKFAEDDLKYLEGLATAHPTSRVYGRISTRAGDQDDWQPSPGATVTLTGPNQKLIVKTDDSGQYSFDGLSPGKYSVSASQSGFDMPSHDYGQYSADVVASGCAAIDVSLNKHWLGGIAGRLFRSDGTRAPAGIDLNLVRLRGEDEETDFSGGVLTDENGEYAFRSVPPGKYKILLHWCCYPTPKAPYAPIYWPSAASEEGGSEVVVGLEPDAKQYDFHLPVEVKSKSMNALVILPDGKPAPGLEIWLLVGDDKHEGVDVGEQIRSDSNGRFSFTILQGLRYFLEVRSDEGGLSSDRVPVLFEATRGLIVLQTKHD
jgi:Carboxypeptidase regulatory-like domain